MKLIRLKDGQTRCNMCEKPIDIDRARSVEFSDTDGEYYKDSVPEGHRSLGWFMVGPECYKKALKSGRAYYKVDVWDDSGMLWEGYSIKEGKLHMRRYKKDGKENIRMYALHSEDETQNWYYSFDKKGKIFKESNHLNN